MSKFKDQTGNTPPLSLDGNTGASAQPSSQSVSTDNTPPFTQTMSMPLPPMLSSENEGLTTLTTPPTTEKTRQHAMLAKVALMQLEKAGLIKRYKVLLTGNEGLTTVQRIRIEFDMSVWSEDLDLK